MDLPQMDSPAIQQLINWVKSSVDRGVRFSDTDESEYDWDVPYVSSTALDEYLSEPEAVERLLGAVFKNDEASRESLHADTVRQKFPKVFCLLIIIGKGWFITHFVEGDINDQRLPFKPHDHGIFPTSTSDPYFFQTFLQKQWQFCVPELCAGVNRRFDTKEYILPLRRTRTLGKGGSATAYQIEVADSYNKLTRKSNDRGLAAGQNADSSTTDKIFVLKTYRRNRTAERCYDSEWRALKKLHGHRPCPHIVGFYGRFILGGVHNILLEYADKGTLEHFLAQHSPPDTAADVVSFWDSFLGVLVGLVMIHNVSGSSADGQSMFQGWHQDIKPTNILIKSRAGGSAYSFDCKLADLGSSHFKRSRAFGSEDTDEDAFGTRAYGAPECFRYASNLERCQLKVKQDVDVWSLGCVMSEVATWVACGWKSVGEYRRQRQDETRALPPFKNGDYCFHDGSDGLLNCVNQNHDELMDNVQPYDYLTTRVVQLIKNDMLKPHYSIGRRSAKYLCEQSQQLIQEVRAAIIRDRKDSSSSDLLNSQDSLWQSSQSTLYTMPTFTPLNFNPPTQHSYHSTASCQPASRGGVHPTPGQLPADPQGRTERPDSTSNIYENDRNGSNLEPVSMHSKSLTFPRRPSSYSQSVSPSAFDTAQCRDGLPYRRHLEGSNFPMDHLVDPISPAAHSHSPTSNGFSITPTQHVDTQSQDIRRLPDIPPITNNRRHSNVPSVWRVEDALRWKRIKKDPKNNEVYRMPKEHRLEKLKGRDHAFLIDNSSSMCKYWQQVRELLDLLAYIVKNDDPDGVDIYFTCPFKKYPSSKTTTALLEKLNRHKPRDSHDISDMSDSLWRIVNEYETYLKQTSYPKRIFPTRRSQTARPLSLYILTDAVWPSSCDVASVVERQVKSLNQHNKMRSQVGIQFIRFGNDPQGIIRLEYLDNLKLKDVVDMDIVDTEPADGSVWKMLLGAIDPWFDDDPPSSDTSASPPLSSGSTLENRFSGTRF